MEMSLLILLSVDSLSARIYLSNTFDFTELLDAVSGVISGDMKCEYY